jgi:hypothetical protein
MYKKWYGRFLYGLYQTTLETLHNRLKSSMKNECEQKSANGALVQGWFEF